MKMNGNLFFYHHDQKEGMQEIVTQLEKSLEMLPSCNGKDWDSGFATGIMKSIKKIKELATNQEDSYQRMLEEPSDEEE